MFYVDGDELVPLSRGGTIPPGTVVVAVPYCGDRDVEVPTPDAVLHGDPDDLPTGTWVYTVSDSSLIRLKSADDYDANDNRMAAYPRTDPHTTLGALRNMVVGGTAAHATDRMQRLAGKAERLAAEFSPDPARPCSSTSGTPLSAAVEQLLDELEELTYRSGSYELAEAPDTIHVRTLAAAMQHNVAVAAAEAAWARAFDPVTTDADLSGPDIDVPHGRLYHVTRSSYTYNDAGYDLTYVALDSVWTSQEHAEARQLELRLCDDIGRDPWSEGYTATSVGSTDVAGAYCADATAHVVLGHRRDDYDGSVYQYVAGVYPSAAEAAEAKAALGKLTRDAPWFGDPEVYGDIDDFAELLGVRSEYVQVKLSSGAQVELAQGLKDDDPLAAKISPYISPEDLVGLPLGATGRVRVNEPDVALRDLASRLVAQGPFEPDPPVPPSPSRIQRLRRRARTRRASRRR